MTELYFLKSTVEVDDETGKPLYFSNKNGWVDLVTASKWTLDEIMQFPYIPMDSKWVKFVETEIEDV